MRCIVTSLLAAFTAAVAIALSSCAADPASPPPPVVLPEAGETIVYSKHIAPIFANSCSGSGCHLNGDNLGGVALNTWEQTMEGAPDFGAEIIPYMARKSHLFQHINTDSAFSAFATPRMPLGRDPLPREQLLAIKRWIDEGAKNDNGEVALGDPGRNRVFIASHDEELVSVIDQATGRVARYIDPTAGIPAPPEGPYGITLSPDGNYFYVGFAEGGTVKKYDSRTLATLGSASIGGAPGQIALTHDGSTLYVANGDHSFKWQSVARIDAATMNVIDTIGPVGLGVQGVVLSADEHTMYTVNTEGDDISVVDLATRKVARQIPVSSNNPVPTGLLAQREPFFGVLDPGGRLLWVTCRKSGEVRVIDLENGRVADSLFVGVRPLMPALTPDGSELWVPNESTNSVSIIDVATRKLKSTLNYLNRGPQAVGFTADGATAYISCLGSAASAHHGLGTESGGLYVIGVHDHHILRTVEIAGGAEGVGVMGR